MSMGVDGWFERVEVEAGISVLSGFAGCLVFFGEAMRYTIGMMNPLRRVDVTSPPRMTTAMGLCISLPGLSLPMTIGMRARAEVRAVIMMGLSRSAEPISTLSWGERPARVRSL